MPDSPDLTPLQRKYAAALTQSTRRKKLWELDTRHHCPLVGTCLTMAELRKLARGAGLQGAAAMSDFTLHHAAVSEAAQRNPFSERIQKYLEKKFGLAIKHFARVRSDAEMLALWQASCARGEAPAGLWAALTHAHIADAAAHKIYEDIHMLSHRMGAETRDERERLQQITTENQELRSKLMRNSERFASDLAEKSETIDALQQRLAEAMAASSRLTEAAQRIAELESDSARQVLLARLAQLERALANAQAQTPVRGEWQPLQRRAAVASPPPDAAACAQCDGADSADCAACDLTGCCVLCVGGRAALYPEYRQLVERAGGQLLVHDGGREDRMDRLPALLSRADIVICPTDNVSHNAYYAVKRYCKRYGKPCALLERSGMSTFSKGVQALAGNIKPGVFPRLI